MTSDKGASLLAKLKYKATKSKMNFQQSLLLLFEEEFLRRLSLSEYANHFILKGGLLIFLLTDFHSRPTADMDFLLRNLSGNSNEIKNMIENILAIPTEQSDVVKLGFSGLKDIVQDRQYGGVSVHLTGIIKNVRVSFNADIGIGDIVIPSPQKIVMPTQIQTLSTLEIAAYSIESVIAEKFDAILQRLELTSRMKDFYDIVCLAKTFNFYGSTLRQAIAQTISNRGTQYNEKSFQRIMELADNPEMNLRWLSFMKNFKMKESNFRQTMHDLQIFIEPVWATIVDDQPFTLKWAYSNYCWE
ncbi:MAG: nucleotidyl transferase AbiEii/AbiGii toxin family protein [Planctomycetia bacterium]|nr:nucleotidyl transferase AbiEii/AbiGii toxin family protein [Planctomycetia bacterium]